MRPTVVPYPWWVVLQALFQARCPPGPSDAASGLGSPPATPPRGFLHSWLGFSSSPPSSLPLPLKDGMETLSPTLINIFLQQNAFWKAANANSGCLLALLFPPTSHFYPATPSFQICSKIARNWENYIFSLSFYIAAALSHGDGRGGGGKTLGSSESLTLGY